MSIQKASHYFSISLGFLSLSIVLNSALAQENPDETVDREPASQRQNRVRTQKVSPARLPIIVPVYPSAEVKSRPQSQPRTGQPIYVPVPVYIQAPPPPPKKSPPLVGLVLTGLLSFEMGSGGNQSFGTPGFGLTVAYSFTPVWRLGITGQLIDATPDDLGTGSGATAVIQVVTGSIEYHFPGLESLFVGVKAGTGFRTSSFSTPLAGTSTLIAPTYGGYAGWNFQIIDPLGLSPQFGVLRIATPIPITDMEIQLGIHYWPWR